jgi:hypothetical protein
MKQICITLVSILLLHLSLSSQVIEYDLFTLTPPASWEKTTADNSITYYKVDSKTKDWCQFILCKSLKSSNNPDTDFTTEWNDLVNLNYKGSGKPEKKQVKKSAGWTIISGTTKWMFNNKQVTSQLITYSGYGIRTSIVCNMTSRLFQPEIDKSFQQLKLIKPTPASTGMKTEPVAPDKTSNHSFAFTTTNFDDGWTSTVRDSWVEVTKAAITVKIHYPDKKADAYQSVLKSEDLNAWNTLVVPAYKQISNFQWKSIQSYESISFMEADAIEPNTGRTKHIVLFKKHYNHGNGRYLEFVADNRSQLDAVFGPYHNTEFDWDKYANMQYRNKFAIAPNDLLGTWSSSDYASLTYYYVSSGATAGTTATTNSNQFTFLPGNKYKSEYAGASGQVGNMKFSTQNYEGKTVVTDWKLTLTNRFKGESETYDALFEAIKGGRILILTDRLGTQLSLVKKSPF